MSEFVQPPGRRFMFELEVEITSELSMSAGEFVTLILDGLFTLDAQHDLFPGVKIPEDGSRVLSASIGAIGYSSAGKVNGHQTNQRSNVARRTKDEEAEGKALHQQMSDAVFSLEDALAEQRMLWAKASALSEAFDDQRPITDSERAQAKAVLQAIEAFLATHEQVVKPVL